MKEIKVFNAKLHNLKNVTITIPKYKLIVVTGISGSGKSSFVFETLHNEGKNLYLESIGLQTDIYNYEAFDLIQGLSPTIAVQQKTSSNYNPRSVVGTTTRILTLLAVLYANEGKDTNNWKRKANEQHIIPGMFMFNSPHGACLQCNGRGMITEVDISSIFPPVDSSIEHWHDFAYSYPQKVKKDKKEYISIRLENFTKLFNCSSKSLFSDLSTEAKETFLNYNPVPIRNKKQLIFYGVKIVLEKRLRKLNTNLPDIQIKKECPRCSGYRLSMTAYNITLNGLHIGKLGKMTISELSVFLDHYNKNYTKSAFTKNIIKEILIKLTYLDIVGLSYLNLYRETPTLSGGELQRLHIMSHLSSKIDSIIYIFDEPTAGLHELEKEKIIKSFHSLKEQGNTVIIVEHDESVIKNADHIIDFGPLAGKFGGNVVYQGDFSSFTKDTTSLTSQYMTKKHKPIKEYPVNIKDVTKRISMINVGTNNLKNVSVDIPLNVITGICGVSGSGKSSLIINTLVPKLTEYFKHKNNSVAVKQEENNEIIYPEPLGDVDNSHNLDGFIVVTQKLSRRSSNSCVATFLGVWDLIRSIFASEQDSVDRKYTAGHFSFNSIGACPVCKGNGYIKRWFSNLSFCNNCPSCDGLRFIPKILEIKYNNKSISNILNFSVSEALTFFYDHQIIKNKLETLEDLGMGYIILGQSLTTLSGGEAQRLKLARELGKKNKGNYLYILDEPTIGLSYYDTEKLLILLNKLVMKNHSVLLIEHDPYVLSYCDYLIEMGPKGGDKGGKVIALGFPEQLKNDSQSLIGKFLN